MQLHVAFTCNIFISSLYGNSPDILLVKSAVASLHIVTCEETSNKSILPHKARRNKAMTF